MLWADDPAGGMWGWLVGAGGVVAGLAPWVLKLLDRRDERQDAVERNALTEAYKLIDRLRQDVDRGDAKAAGMEARLEEMRADHEACKVQYARAVARIDHLEEALTNARIPFRPWRPDPDTGEHRPLPPGGTP